VCISQVEGCRRWQTEGLGAPPEVCEASAKWQEESDRFRAFVAERYVVGTGGWVPVTEPWTAYGAWCELNHERNRLEKTAFDTKLGEIGCIKGTRNNGTVRAWIGIQVRSLDDDSRIGSDKLTPSDSKL